MTSTIAITLFGLVYGGLAVAFLLIKPAPPGQTVLTIEEQLELDERRLYRTGMVLQIFSVILLILFVISIILGP